MPMRQTARLVVRSPDLLSILDIVENNSNYSKLQESLHHQHFVMAMMNDGPDLLFGIDLGMSCK